MLQQSRQYVARIRANKAPNLRSHYTQFFTPQLGRGRAPRPKAQNRADASTFFLYEFCLSMGFNHVIELRLEFTCGPVIILGVTKHPPCWSQEFFLVLAS